MENETVGRVSPELRETGSPEGEGPMTATPYTLDVIPFPDKSMRYFERALIETTPASPARIRAILRQCWRDIHNLGGQNA